MERGRVRCGLIRCGLVVVVLLGAVTPAFGGWWDDLDRGQSAELNDVIARPSQYADRILSIFCIYLGTDTVFAPLAAPYNPERHENLAVWADGAPLWEKEAYENFYPFLYIDRSHPQHGELVRLERFTRIEVTCRIRGQIRYRPCLAIRSFRRTGHRLGEAVVKSVIAGDRHAEAGQFELSFENYRRALQPDLPPAYDLQVRKRVAGSLRRLGRIDEAMQMEGGPILGGGQVPEARDRPAGGYLGDPLPGQPAPLGTPSDPPAPAPAPSPFSRDDGDLPGTPAGNDPAPLPAPAPAPSPFTHDLPGTPSAPPIIPANPPPGGEPKEPEVEEREEEEAPPPAPVPPGAPPRQAPRLSGVK